MPQHRFMYEIRLRTILTHSARVVHSTSYSDVTSRPSLGPYVSFLDVLLRPGVRRTSSVGRIKTRRQYDVVFASATNKDVRKTYVRAQIRSSSQRPWTSCRVGNDQYFSRIIRGTVTKGKHPKHTKKKFSHYHFLIYNYSNK